jgi:hypothetical protein
MLVSEDKYKIAVEALRKIAAFGHAESCNGSAPVHECSCYYKDERELAQAALDELGE